MSIIQKTNIAIFFIIIITIISCNREKEFLIIKDNRYFEPSHRLKKIIDNDSLYSLNRRFFVYNYQNNKEKFDSISLDMMCDAINDSLSLMKCSFDFQEVPYYQSEYKPNQGLSTDFTKTIVFYHWDISEPKVVKSEWGESFEKITKNIELICE